MTLDFNQLDPNGIPILKTDCVYGPNELKLKEKMKTEAVAMLKAAGFRNVRGYSVKQNPGLAIHELGTARMGADPGESYLNSYNQSHEVDNLFVTDGAAFASSACQNPSLTFMALTARAADYADKQMKSGAL